MNENLQISDDTITKQIVYDEYGEFLFQAVASIASGAILGFALEGASLATGTAYLTTATAVSTGVAISVGAIFGVAALAFFL